MKKLDRILRGRFILLSLLPICALTVFFTIVMLTNTNSRMEGSLKSATQYGGQLLQEVITEADAQPKIIASSTDVQEMLRNNPQNFTDMYKQRLLINGYLMTNHNNNIKDVDACYILLRDGRSFKSTNFPLLKKDFTAEAWFERILAQKKLVWMGQYDASLIANNRRSGYVSLGAPLLNLKSGEYDGVVLVEIRIESILTLIENGLTMEQVSATILDQDGRVVLSTDANRQDADVTASVALSNGWQLKFSCNMFALMLPEVLQVIGIAVVALLLVILAALFLGQRTALFVSRPIHALLHEMESTDGFRKKVPVNIHSNIAEIQSLIVNYNLMVKRLQELFVEVEHTQRALRKSEFAALQAQINPHFLYNTLDNISWQIRGQHYEQALQSLMAFGKYFRLSLSKGASMVSVAAEIQHVQLYLDIQRTRFVDVLSYTVSNYLQHSDMEENYVPKLILQPLIENAINHGIQNKGSSGTIQLSIRRENQTIVFTVLDDGVGIEPQELELMNRALAECRMGLGEKNEKGYGIYNVNLRLRHIFGAQYGLRMESEWGKLTRAIVTVPLNGNDQLEEGQM